MKVIARTHLCVTALGTRISVEYAQVILYQCGIIAVDWMSFLLENICENTRELDWKFFCDCCSDGLLLFI